MLQQQVYVINTVLMVIDALCIILAGYGAYYFKWFQAGYLWSMDNTIFIGSVMMVMFLNNYVMGKFGLYDDSRKPSYWALITSIAKAVFVTFSIFTVVVFLYKEIGYSRIFLLAYAFLSLALLTLFRTMVHTYFNNYHRSGFNTRRILVVGDRERAGKISEVLNNQLSYGHEIIGRLASCEEEQLRAGHPGEPGRFRRCAEEAGCR